MREPDEFEAKRAAEENLDYEVAFQKCAVCGQWTKEYVKDGDRWLCGDCFRRDGT